MNLTTVHSPLRAMQSFDSDFDRLFQNLLFDRAPRRAQGFLNLDVVENDNAYEVYADLPGVKQEDIEISLTSNVLSIKGSRHTETGKKEGSVHRESHNSFERALTLPDGIDTEKIEANMKNGVLKLHIPKTEEAAARKIEINAGKKK